MDGWMDGYLHLTSPYLTLPYFFLSQSYLHPLIHTLSFSFFLFFSFLFVLPFSFFLSLYFYFFEISSVICEEKRYILVFRRFRRIR